MIFCVRNYRGSNLEDDCYFQFCVFKYNQCSLHSRSPYLSLMLLTHNYHLLSNCSFLLCVIIVINTKRDSLLDIFILEDFHRIHATISFLQLFQSTCQHFPTSHFPRLKHMPRKNLAADTPPKALSFSLGLGIYTM